MHVKAAGIQRVGDAADISALAGGVPALVAEDDGDLLPVDDVMQLAQALLEPFELLLVILVRDGGREVHLGQLRHFDERELLVKGLADIPPVLKCLVDFVYQELHGVPYSCLLALAVEDMPVDGVVRILHEIVIGLEEFFVFLVLPQIVRRDAPLRFRVLTEGAETLVLLLFVDVQEDLEQEIAPVPQLAFKLIDAADAALVFLLRDLQPQDLADGVFHPAGIQEDQLAVLRDGGGIGIEEGIACFALRDYDWGDHVIETGIDLADDLLDQAALAGGGPALQQHEHGEFGLPEELLLHDQPGAQFLDLRVERFFFFRLGFLEIL